MRGPLPRSVAVTLTDRGILKEMAAAFLLGLMALTFVLLTGKILRLVELIVGKGIGILTVLQLFLYIIPYTLVVTIPMSALLATLVTFARLAGDNEIVALQSAGVSVARLARPAIGFGLMASAVTLAITVWIMPLSYHAFSNLLFQVIWRHVAVTLQEGVFNSDFEGLILYAEKLDAQTSTLEGVFLVDNRNPEEQRVIVARAGQFTSDPQQLRMELRLSQGSIHLSAADAPGRYRQLTFAQYNLRLEAGRTLSSPLQRSLRDKELTLAELRQRARELRAQGKNERPPMVEFHKKLAIPFS
ncbi:MAG TPA: LptF/LptG family permease, partial [Solirubrobacterales bacterium]|nr:LptF/LptG family permease [Solirubrobacterales bacterium]